MSSTPSPSKSLVPGSGEAMLSSGGSLMTSIVTWLLPTAPVMSVAVAVITCTPGVSGVDPTVSKVGWSERAPSMLLSHSSGSGIPVNSVAVPLNSRNSSTENSAPLAGVAMFTCGGATSTPSAAATAPRALMRRWWPVITMSKPTPPSWAVSRRMSQIAEGPRPGSAALTSAATPATNGEAKLVPQVVLTAFWEKALAGSLIVHTQYGP